MWNINAISNSDWSTENNVISLVCKLGNRDVFMFQAIYCSLFSIIQKEHTKSILAIDFDEFQIVSSSMDNTILIWNFANGPSTQITTSNPIKEKLPPSEAINNMAKKPQNPKIGTCNGYLVIMVVGSWACCGNSKGV